MPKPVSATLRLAFRWQSQDVEHVDHCLLPDVGLEQDALPRNLRRCLAEHGGEVTCRDAVAAGELVPPHDDALIATLDRSLFKTRPRRWLRVTPHVGRFYPLNFLSEDVFGLDEPRRLFRILAMDDEHMTVDANHPLAAHALELEAAVERWGEPSNRQDASADAISRLISGGPGMQAELAEGETDFWSDDPFAREDPAADTVFYEKPRLVHHLDSQARAHIGALYGRFLQPGMQVLDLMTSWVSHLPEGPADLHVTGLGLNRDELDANPRLDERMVHDLNADPSLPLGDACFDMALCTASVEYLVKPVEVFREVARTLRPGGCFVVTFSDRWFPTKMIRVWGELHPFERMGLVLSYFRRTGLFTDLHTESWRGWPRPADDKYADQLDQSDPVFAVWGRRA